MAADSRAERLFPRRPFVGVGAVVWDGQRVLLARRGQPPAQGLWSLPGGLVEVGERVEEAVRREVREECGIEVEVGPLVGLFEPIVTDEDGRVRYHYVVVDFLTFYTSGTAQAGDDATDLAWVTPAELAAYDLVPGTHDMVTRALRPVTA
jgi:ADP-ribose pyrophosphatase YjhB (NUDIX family)